MAHDGESGGEERGLGALPVVTVRAEHRRIVETRDAPVEPVAHRRADERSEGTAEHESDAAAQKFPPPAHV